jgi:hypothetical protein
MAKSNAALSIIFGADTKQLDKALGEVGRKLRATSDALTDVGTKLSIGLTAPIAAFGAVATKNFVDSAKALAQVDAAVKSTGGAAGKSVAQLEEMAAGLQRMSLFDDDQILKEVTANLLTFTNVTGTEFDKAQVAILNMSTRLGTDLTSASIQVGKALNDPIKGVKALGRAGVQFTAEQKAQIEALQESGDVAGAQAVILKELETQFGGAAEAAAKTDPYTQLANEVGNLSEDFGKIISEALLPLVQFVQRAADSIKGWSEGTKRFVVIAGGLLAVLGPTLVVIGQLVGAYTTIRGAIAAAAAAKALETAATNTATAAQNRLNIAVLKNPYVIAAVAIAVLVTAILTFKSAADKAKKAKEDFDESIAEQTGKVAMESISKQAKKVNADLEEQKRIYAELRRVQDAQGTRVQNNTIRQLNNTAALIDALEQQRVELAAQYQQAAAQNREQERQNKLLQESTKVTTTHTETKTAATTVEKTYNDVLAEQLFLASATLQVTGDQEAYVESLADAYRDAAIAAKLAGDNARSAALAQGPGAGGLTARAPSQIANPTVDAPRGLMAPSPNVADGYTEISWAAGDAAANAAELNSIIESMSATAVTLGDQFGRAFGMLMMGADGAQDAMRNFAAAAVDAAFQAATAFAIQAASQTSLAAGPGAAILLPVLITAGIGLMREVFRGITGLATGGLTTGPMLAMIGDNASGKEAVIPFERMGEFLDMAGANQPSNVTVTGRISGRDIMLSNERSSRDRKRIR